MAMPTTELEFGNLSRGVAVPAAIVSIQFNSDELGPESVTASVISMEKSTLVVVAHAVLQSMKFTES